MPPITLKPGVWGVLTTPFTGSTLDVDVTSLAALAEHYERAGANGFTVLGVFGEAAQLDTEERRTVLQTVAEATSLPLVVGSTSLGTAPVAEEARLAQQVLGDRMAAVMVQVNSPNPVILTNHLRAVHERTGAGIVVQDYPLVSGVHIAAPALARALRDLPFVVAVKAEAPPTPTAVAALTKALDVPVFGGLGGIGLLDELACGAAGAMTGFSYPEGLIACVEAWQTGGYEQARQAWLPYLPLVNFEQQASIALAIRKECLRRRGLLRESAVRPPASPLPEVLVDQLGRHLGAVPQPAGAR
ncbi:dihydrodipicolinate synthase family protein [Streptomyces sp. NBC_01462]|uniref:dihydrodipicolinate synthase family protein n=1 Tax=Streptomyces sp. NBC_01462 TaxID=2903876 RepID=UPI002E305956|nr:dihydrodipicolinate synthase family protein [Streptomyces sp. NBC_01462]